MSLKYLYLIVSDVVETVTFETETSSKLRDRDSKLKTETETRDFKICSFSRISFFNAVIASELIFYRISGIFPTCFGCFLPANITKNIVEL